MIANPGEQRMRKTFLSTFFLVASSLFAAAGWRPQEMEIKVLISCKEDARNLASLNLQGEMYHSGYALMDVTPEELTLVRRLGLSYEIIIPDCNDYYRDFWTSKTHHAQGYSTYEQIIADMDSLVADYPALCRKTIAGRSVDNRELCYLKITATPDQNLKKPKVLFDAGIHGVELGGPENAIRFAQDMCRRYATDTAVKNLVDSREIYVYCMVNPDGRAAMTRENANMVDCNRNYPYMGGPATEPEVKAMRSLLLSKNFAVHVTYHSGEEALLYPWCYEAAAAAEKAVWVNLANVYKAASGYSTLIINQSYADYPTTGETIDFSYGCLGNAALTMEISNDQQTTDITGYYNKNAPAMRTMIEYAGYGIQGTVTDGVTKKPVAAVIFVNNAFPLYADSAAGDYHKYVPAGSYSVIAMANGYLKTATSAVVADKKATNLDIALVPDTGAHSTWGYRVVSVQSGTENTSAVLGRSDGVCFTQGAANGIVVDMQYPIPDAAGADFKVYVAAGTASFTCSAAAAIDGPFQTLGTATATSQFDLAGTGLAANARFVKITGNGVKLDAIEALHQIPTGIASLPAESAPLHQFSVVSSGAEGIAVRCAFSAPAEASLYDARGKMLRSAVMPPGPIALQWRSLARGVYIVKASVEGGNDILEKAVIR
jgi:predicted deacylase